MGLIEVEITDNNFSALTMLVASAGPIPVPTFGAIGNDRLIADLEWDGVVIGAAPPGFVAPPGTVPASASVKVRHVSVAELRADAGAAGTVTDATVWLLLSLAPGRLVVDAVRIDAGGASQSFGPFLRLGTRPLALSGAGAIAGTALVHADGFVTLRFATAAGDAAALLAPPANRLAGIGGGWLIRVSGEVLAEQVLARLRDGVDPPPSGTTIEDAPSASWSSVGGGWGVNASVGLVKEDACPGLFGDVDMSVTVNVEASFTPNLSDETLRIQLRISSDASDWDTFRCWAGSAGIGALLLGGITTPIVGVAAGIGSLIAVSEIIRGEVGSQVTGTGVGGDLTKVSGDQTSATYEGKTPLPTLPQTVNDATVGADGLVVTGSILLAPATHTRTFSPAGGTLGGTWHGRFSCSKNRWMPEYAVEPVLITDEALVIGNHFANVPVTVFPTSIAEPPEHFALDYSNAAEINQYVGITALDVHAGQTGTVIVHTSAGVRRYDIAPVGPEPPAPSDVVIAAYVVNCKHFTEYFGPGVRIKWLVDPPPYELGLPAIRQWLVSFAHVPAGATAALQPMAGDTEVGAPLRAQAANDGALVLEIVTDGATDVRLDFDVPGERPQARLSQRWLLPTQVVDIGAPVADLRRAGATIGALAADRLVTIDLARGETTPVPAGARGLARDGDRLVVWGDQGALAVGGAATRRLTHRPVSAVARDRLGRLALRAGDETFVVDGDAVSVVEDAPPAMPGAPRGTPLSVSLPDGRVVAAWNDKIVVAIPGAVESHTNEE